MNTMPVESVRWKEELSRELVSLKLIPPGLTGSVRVNLNQGGVTSAEVTITHK